jgi:hypothetical protein
MLITYLNSKRHADLMLDVSVCVRCVTLFGTSANRISFLGSKNIIKWRYNAGASHERLQLYTANLHFSSHLSRPTHIFNTPRDKQFIKEFLRSDFIK